MEWCYFCFLSDLYSFDISFLVSFCLVGWLVGFYFIYTWLIYEFFLLVYSFRSFYYARYMIIMLVYIPQQLCCDCSIDSRCCYNCCRELTTLVEKSIAVWSSILIHSSIRQIQYIQYRKVPPTTPVRNNQIFKNPQDTPNPPTSRPRTCPARPIWIPARAGWMAMRGG